MRFENPVADVDNVDVLFHDDVSRQNFVAYPVAEPHFRGRRLRPLRAVDVASEVMGFAADDFTEGAVVDTAGQFDKGRAIADLEADIEAKLSLRALADVDDSERSGHVDRDGLFEIDVFARGDDGFEMLRMEIRRSGDDDGIHFLRCGNLLEGIGAGEQLSGVNDGKSFGLQELVEV